MFAKSLKMSRVWFIKVAFFQILNPDSVDVNDYLRLNIFIISIIQDAGNIDFNGKSSLEKNFATHMIESWQLPRWRVVSVEITGRKIDFVGNCIAELTA